jgi:hypothetical protein
MLHSVQVVTTVSMLARIEWQVEPGTDADFEYATFGGWHNTAAIGSEISLPH